MKNRNHALFAALVLCLIVQGAWACTGFAMKGDDGVLVCLSYDHQFGAGYICVNKRNVERRRYSLLAEKPFRWVSKYGNVTFNLVARDYPHDGMNEAGLVVLSMGLDGTRFPAPDSRPSIDELGWIQYQLDTAASVEEVIRSLRQIRISTRSMGDSHFLIADRTGKAAVIEYVEGQPRVYTGGDLPSIVLANDTYPNMLAYLMQQKAFGGPQDDPYRAGSSRCRFTRVATAIRDYQPTNGPMMEYAFGILSEVRRNNSQYQVIYDTHSRSIYYRSLGSTDTKSIQFDELDLDCASPVVTTEIQSTNRGNIDKAFCPYDANRSRTVLAEFNRQTFGYLPAEVLANLAEAPCQSRCRAKATAAPLSGLVVALQPPAESRIIIPNRAETLAVDFEVKLNRAATDDLDCVFEVPSESSLIPGDNVFIAPNPIRIESGRQSATARVFLITNRLQPGVEARLTVNLLSEAAALGEPAQFSIQARREAAP